MLDYAVKNKFIFILLLTFSFVLTNDWVFSIKDSLYYESDLSSFYGSSEWKKASPQQRKKMTEDFIIREGSYFFSIQNKLNLLPSFVQKTKNRERELLVNYLYKTEISRLAADSSRVDEGLRFLNKEVFVNHILFGHEEASLRVPVKRSKTEALDLCSSVLDTLTEASFSDAALKFSDDGGVKLNKGRIGWVSWGSTPSPVFEKAVFSSKESLVGPIETEFGYHIAQIKEERPSSFSFLSENEYKDMVYIRASSRDIKKLKEISKNYDSLIIQKEGLSFNNSFVVDVFSEFSNNKKNVSSYEKNDIVSLLKQVDKRGVVCVYGGEGFGLQWFIKRLEAFSPSNRPPITDIDSFYSILRTLLLQESAFLLGKKRGLDRQDIFKKQFLSYQKDLLFNIYFKDVVNRVSKPEPALILDYYEKNKDQKYKTKKSLKLKEIRVNSWEEGDWVLNKYIEGESFDSLCIKNSISWNETSRGFLGPIEEDFENKKLSSLFVNSKEGSVSDLYKNEDGSYSLYLISKIYPAAYIPYKKVSSRISSFLHKEGQEKEKEREISLFYKNLNIMLNEDLF